MPHHAEVVALQLAALVLTAAGWGYWLSRWTGNGWATAAAGLSAGWLILQDLLPAGLTLAVSSWFGAAVALAGILTWTARLGWNASSRRVRFLRPSFEGGVVAAVFIIVFTFQAAGLIFWGPRDYYGYGRQDQVNYTQTAQFLIEKPFGMKRSDVRLDPWVVKGIDTKYDRIGQSVAQGYLAVITGTDASRSYGTISVFFVALAAIAVISALRAFGVALAPAAAAGLWTGLLPALTQTQLDGFFSQTATLFCFPFLAQLGVAFAQGENRAASRRAAILAAVILAFLLGAYSEEYVLGAALFFLTVALAGRSRSGVPVRHSFSDGGPPLLAGALLITVLPWLILAPFSAHVAGFISNQYHADQASIVLSVWQPEAGTWQGWAHIFFAGGTAAVVAGGLILALALCGAVRRRAHLAMAIVPAAILAVLARKSPFPQYTFGKLTDTFAPLVVVLTTVALVRRPRTAVALLVPAVFCAAFASWPKLQKVFRNQESLDTANWPAARVVYRELDAHPERVYRIIEPHGLLNSWLAYHARHARTYSAVPIGDSFMDQSYPFLRAPPRTLGYWAVRGSGLTYVPPRVPPAAGARN